MSIPRNSEHLAAFWGAIQALAQRYTWGKPLTADSDTLATFWAGIIAENRQCYEEAIFMSNGGCGCCPETLFRYTAEGIQQFSTDNGETWEDFPGDERMSGSIIPPPVWLLDPSSDHACQGANTAIINIENGTDEILGAGATTVNQLIGVIVTAICAATGGTVCGIAALVGGGAAITISVTAAAIQAEMTPENYELLKCILFCHIEDDATFTEAGWLAVKTDIVETFGGNAEFWFWNFVNWVGPVGLTNLARLSITVSDDCSGCACEPCENAFPIVGTETDHPDEFTWVYDSEDDGFGQQVVIIQFGSGGIDQCCCLVSVDITGFAPFEFYRPCGDPDQVAGNPGSSSIWEYRRGTGVGGAAFSMTVTVEVCP
jgi:hypothetical protein